MHTCGQMIHADRRRGHINRRTGGRTDGRRYRRTKHARTHIRTNIYTRTNAQNTQTDGRTDGRDMQTEGDHTQADRRTRRTDRPTETTHKINRRNIKARHQKRAPRVDRGENTRDANTTPRQEAQRATITTKERKRDGHRGNERTTGEDRNKGSKNKKRSEKRLERTWANTARLPGIVNTSDCEISSPDSATKTGIPSKFVA